MSKERVSGLNSRQEGFIRPAPELGQRLVRPELGLKPISEGVLFSRVDDKPVSERQDPEQGLEVDQDKVQKPAGDWEPFLLEPSPEDRFVNLYGGPFSQQMELNRKNVERFIEVAGLEGNITLVDVPRDRRAAGVSVTSVTPEGTATAGKVKSAEKRKTAHSTSEGWRIEIPGEDILDELSRKESKNPLDQRFTARFSQLIRDSMREILLREKLTSEKHSMFWRIFGSSTPWWGLLSASVTDGSISSSDLVWAIGIAGVYYPFMNLLPKPAQIPRSRENLSFYEYFLPFIELDRVLRGLAFVNLKGRNLIRLKKIDAD